MPEIKPPIPLPGPEPKPKPEPGKQTYPQSQQHIPSCFITNNVSDNKIQPGKCEDLIGYMIHEWGSTWPSK